MRQFHSKVLRRQSSQALICIALLALWIWPNSIEAADRWKFTVSLSKRVRDKPFSGRVYIFFSEKNIQPRFGPSWMTPEQFIAKDVTDWKTGTPLTFSSSEPDGVLAYPKPMQEMNLAGFRAQAVARFNPNVRGIGRGAGNGFSEVIKVVQTEESYDLTISDLVRPRKYNDTKWGKELRVRSELLSKFHGRDVFQAAAIFLPGSYYTEPQRRYPVIYSIPGFSGEHYDARLEQPIREQTPGGVEFIRVLLNPSCALGHHVFADSANNGPRGKCLIDEFIPAFEKQYRAIAKPDARFVTGHSSGGWSSLWLQITYPETFGGAWSTAPDPVDFTDFSRVNLYKDKNFYTDSEGKDRPIARVNGKIRLWLKGFSMMEHTLGHGGQLNSFEAVFGTKDTAGKPQKIWNRETGAINHAAVENWKTYDIRHVLEQNWKTLGPKLAGKLHVFVGSEDSFYLEGATIKLKATLEKLGSDAVVEVHRGRDHSNLVRGGLRMRIRREIAERFLKSYPKERR